MTGPEYGNAMTEIALALAMAFFALMILTMVSMGAGQGTATATSLQLAVATEASDTDGAAGTPPSTPIEPDQLIIFADGRFYDAALQEIDPAATAGRHGLILGLPPQLPLAAAMQAKLQLAAEDVTVVPLSDDWQSAVEALAR